MSTKKCLEIILTGKVQNVGLRESVQEYANDNGIKGYIRNKEDGRVKIIAYGEKLTLDNLIHHCSNGHNWSEIDEMVIKEIKPRRFSKFHILKSKSKAGKLPLFMRFFRNLKFG